MAGPAPAPEFDDPSWYIAQHRPLPEKWGFRWENPPASGEAPLVDFERPADLSRLACSSELFAHLHERLDRLEQLEAEVSSRDRRLLREQITPTGKVGSSIFLDRAGVKLANIDRIFNVTGSMADYLRPRDQEYLTYADLAGGPGAFTNYIQFRRRISFGIGITLKGDWRTEWHLDSKETEQKYYRIFGGPDDSGDLIRYSREFVRYVLSEVTLPVGEYRGVRQNPKGTDTRLDLVVADGWAEPQESQVYRSFGQAITGKAVYRYAELVNFDLIATELAVGVQIVRLGGNLVCKVMHTVTEPMVQLLWLVSQCFRMFTIFKPISSWAISPEHYVIGMLRRESPAAEALRLLQEQIAAGKTPLGLCSVPENFRTWLMQVNDFHLAYQTKYVERTLEALRGRPVSDNLDLQALQVFWRLPGVFGESYHDPITEQNVTGKLLSPIRP